MASTPRYARDTMASFARSSNANILKHDKDLSETPKTPSKIPFKVPPKTPDKVPVRAPRPKRARNSNSALLTIKPYNTNEPCHLAKLPAELRLQIFSYVLPAGPLNVHNSDYRDPGCWSNLWPALLRVCRIIRSEAAYIFYLETAFTCRIWNLNFYPITRWIKSLPRAHRPTLSMNRNLTLVLQVQEVSSRSTVFQWRIFTQFGTSFMKCHEPHRMHFINFTRLALWWLACSSPLLQGINWHYDIDLDNGETYWTWYGYPKRSETMKQWCHSHLLTPALPCVQKNWTVETDKKGRMKAEAWNMISEIDKCFKELPEDSKKCEMKVVWNGYITSLRNVVGKWE